ncbi:lytic murein transglycosylase [Nocardioides donggukensis]|uniref:Lytic murein transglycosylase n=1 Tax=Nocardioides donggukensis TaxID=2774019 RepID=A0A927K389_9ACTN|nr:lytic murein transglycosylase [Nocardioides donggukensis]MBD8869772.1 lytic murein transglycosylase [Nocardioides donggukensis]
MSHRHCARNCVGPCRLARRHRGHALRAVTVTVALLLGASAYQGEVPVTATSAAVPTDSVDAAGTATVASDAPTGPATAARARFRLKPDRTSRVSPNGTRLWGISATTTYGLPVVARRAYEAAAATTARVDPGCGLRWPLLAGIGRVESDHGRYGDAELRSDGVARPKILGLPLNGVGPVAAIRDTDGGRLDGDRTWDRAVGPMQFIPSTWAMVARDGDRDGRRDPHDIDDTALAAAAYLCRAGDLRLESRRRAAVFSYNHSTYYVDLVLAFARGYETGVFDIPAPPAPEPAQVARTSAERPRAARKAQPARQPVRQPVKQPTAAPTKAPTKSPSTPTVKQPTKTPSKPPKQPPKPAEPTKPPAPPPLVLAPVSGTWSAGGAGWTLGALQLDLGGAARLDVKAHKDYDGDGAVETNRAEFTGLEGRQVAIQVKQGTGVVYVIAGLDYRGADGSFLS